MNCVILFASFLFAGSSALPIYGIPGLTNVPVYSVPYDRYLTDDRFGYVHGYYPHVGVPVEPAETYYHSVRSVGDVYTEPVLVFITVPGKQDEAVACVVPGGLGSFQDNACTKRIYNEILAGEKKKALLLHPSNVNSLYKVKALKITDINIPEGLDLYNLTRALKGQVPWLLILAEKEYERYADAWNPVKIAEIPVVPNSSIQVEKSSYPLGTTHPYYTPELYYYSARQPGAVESSYYSPELYYYYQPHSYPVTPVYYNSVPASPVVQDYYD